MTTSITAWKVGDLARDTGLTVRTLHHYDRIGLLVPSHRTTSGHRVYTADDVKLLYQIVALRHLGLGLDQIAEALQPDADPLAVVAGQLAEVERQLAAGRRLRDRLVAILDTLTRYEEPSATHFLSLIEETRMTEDTVRSYYTAEQLDWLARRREELGEDAILAAEAEWPALIERAQREMEAGTDPSDPRVQAIAARWDELVAAFHGGREDIKAGVTKLWQEQGDDLPAGYGGPSPDLMTYLEQARDRTP